MDAVGARLREIAIGIGADVGAFAGRAMQALLVVLVAIVVARVLRRRAVSGLRRTGIDPNLVSLIANGTVIGVYVLAGAAVLSLLGGSVAAAATVLGAGTVAISLALQDVLRGFVAGIYLLLERPFSIGDRIKVGDTEGVVEAIDLRTTVLRGDETGRIYVPNATVFSGVVTNRGEARLTRTTIRLSGLAAAGDPVAAAAALLADLPGVTGQPTLTEVSAEPDGVGLAWSVSHAPEADVAGAAAARLRARFPDASVVAGREGA